MKTKAGWCDHSKENKTKDKKKRDQSKERQMGVINLDPDQCFPNPHFPIIVFSPYFHISYFFIIFLVIFLFFNFSSLFIFHFNHTWVTNHPNVQVYVNP